MMLFTLADRWGEPDPRKIADLPANILTYWQAYLDLLEQRNEGITAEKSTSAAAHHHGEQQYADCLRILGNG